MPLTAFDHINIRTANLDAMIEWYGEVLDMHPGPRPNFPFPGAWLYLGDKAIIHLVGLEEEPDVADVRLEHAAFRATGLSEFLARLKTLNIESKMTQVADINLTLVNIHDPDGNHLHIDFDSSETAA